MPQSSVLTLTPRHLLTALPSLLHPCKGNAGNLGLGMFAQLNEEPKGARLYRSQVTEEELRLATTGVTPAISGVPGSGGQPIIDHEAVYPGGPGRRWRRRLRCGEHPRRWRP